MGKVFVHLGSGAGDLDSRVNFRCGFTEFIKKNFDTNDKVFCVEANPFNIEKIWRRVFSSGYSQRPDISLGGVLSAIEIALWDINGKELNKPIYELLGGKHTEKLRTYTYIYPEPNDASNVYTNAILAGERAAEYLKQGFDAVKFDPVGQKFRTEWKIGLA